MRRWAVVLVVGVGCSKEAPAPVAAPQSVKVQLPRARSGDATVTVAQVHLEPGVVMLDGAAVKPGELAEKLRALRKETPSVELHVDAAGEVPYEQVVAALDAARQAGIMDVSLDSGPQKPSETPQKP